MPQAETIHAVPNMFDWLVAGCSKGLRATGSDGFCCLKSVRACSGIIRAARTRSEVLRGVCIIEKRNFKIIFIALFLWFKTDKYKYCISLSFQNMVLVTNTYLWSLK